MSTALTIAGVSTIQAQSLFDKIDNIANQVNRAANTTEGAAKTGGGILSLFNKKEKVKQQEARLTFLLPGQTLCM